MTNKEKASITYKILQKRKRTRKIKSEKDIMGLLNTSVDRMYKKNYRGTKRRGQI